MKKLLELILLLSICTTSYIYREDITTYIVTKITTISKETTTLQNNTYSSSNSYSYVQLIDNFEPNNKNDIINIYYTILNSGMTNFTFHCNNEYKECINDVNYISNNQKLLSEINNFVPIYNSFSNIETEFDSLGKVSITIKHNYTQNDITEIEEKISAILKETIKEEMNNEEKIKTIHDYIINNTKYDINRSDNKVNTYKSDTAYGALIEHYAICGGYADSMKLFLDKLNIENYKISSENHVWNLVNINNNWYHLDLTWDDPVTSTGEDILEYDYFLITTEELKELKTDQHGFDEIIYRETKSN